MIEPGLVTELRPDARPFRRVARDAVWKLAPMSYDLAVWEGERPADDEIALDVLGDLCGRYLEADVEHPPTTKITAYVAALLERWPDITEAGVETSPWCAGPLIDDARGPIIYLPITRDAADETSAYAAALAGSMGLICFDPQLGRLRP